MLIPLSNVLNLLQIGHFPKPFDILRAVIILTLC